jgi:uncharacterized protein (DUF4415 family)
MNAISNKDTDTNAAAKNRRTFLRNTPEEEAAIMAGIAADPDTYEVSDAEFKTMRRGRPAGSGTKTLVSLRLDSDTLAKYKATGAGWQTRINEALKQVVI